ncbi:M48 family metalloprotease [Terricaulis silvestris]|uniref:TPR repeat-containing protein YfgC n=1 Tax=Terricaulis silvestris TaxID=2686094 RepID=A0A6I6MPW1_9CAUL|nr:M48 family metalloprotease [Terricaulis silvestris]QGZ95416.1 TPR repeat-containing protein YfgC precursor [Terricaulis silvestris]
MAASLSHALKTCAGFAAAASAAVLLSVSDASAQSMIRDAEIEDSLHVYTAPLLTAAGLTPADIDLYIINDDSINAFVSNGQNIFVHTGLILAADNPNELLGVLAHETGHIAGGHLARSREAIGQSMGVSLISIGLGVLAIAAGAPDAGAALISGSQAFAMGNYVRHTQVQESAADQAAMQYLERTGQSGQGLVDFFNENMRPYEFMMRRAPPYLITHPYSSDRVESLRVRVEEQPHHDATDSAENLRRFAFMQAKLVGFLRTEAQTLSRYPTSDTSQPARYARAVAYYRASQLDLARGELNVLIAEDPNNAYFQELMGQILFENGRAEESIPYHQRSNDLAPNQPLLQINLARALTAARGRAGADAAVPLLQAAIDREPDNAFAWRELAQARNQQGNESLAELASAEQNFAIGNFPAALNFAERARRGLARNTPSYQRSVDIVTFSSTQIRDMDRERRR